MWIVLVKFSGGSNLLLAENIEALNMMMAQTVLRVHRPTGMEPTGIAMVSGCHDGIFSCCFSLVVPDPQQVEAACGSVLTAVNIFSVYCS